MHKNQFRQLSAVMFTDIVGYSKMMNRDEKHAAEIRAIHREAFNKYHKLYSGDLIQYFGDGTLSVFKSTVEAVGCAIAIQKELKNEHSVPLRIGLHVGDIVYDGADIYGDGVNLASRIENLCPTGSVLVSGKLAEDLQNHQQFSTKSLGQFELKNISLPIELHAIVDKNLYNPSPSELSQYKQKPDNTVAVLPFVNMSSDSDAEFFSDGITEEIINALAKIENLKVISRTSSFYYKNQNIPLKKIAEQLGVANILEGSVRVAGGMVRITAQLIQARDDFHFWSQTWDRKMENIFEIQDEISLLIAEKLREQYGHLEIQEHLIQQKTISLEAYEYWLKARYHHNKWNPVDVEKAIELYRKALSIDSEHTDSYVGLADAFSFMAVTEMMPHEEAWQKVMAYNDKAYALNPENAGVHYQLANIAFFREADFRKSVLHALKAIELKSNYPEAQHFISFLYMISGEMDKAKHHLEIAHEIDPLSQETLFYRAYHLYRSENFTDALALFDECLLKNPNNIPAYIVRSYCLLKMEKYDEAIDSLEKMPKEIIVPGERLGILSLAYILKQDSTKIETYFNRLKKEAENPTSFQAHSYLYIAYGLMGKADEAFAWLEKALKLKSSILFLGFSDPLVKNLQKDPRYLKYHKKLYHLDSKQELIERKKEPLLDRVTASKYTDKLLEFTHQEKPYLNPNISLRTLSELVEIHPNYLSWVLNEQIGKNFNEFINHFRVEHFKQLATNPSNAHISLIGLAYESGFNSKTVFNTFFKKETGMTPKEYLKSKQ